MRSSILRQSFLDFFAKKGHTILPSASLIPHGDPSLLFTAAGMVPFKDFFTGEQTPPSSCVASSQKCVRVGGKHNDLEQVGRTARHHTFFEMLGNFSFGDYFKEKAICYAWEFLTQVLDLSKEKLWITVYHEDDEAFSLWRKIAGVPESRIIRIATDDNFWSAGPLGPCGPCSEIFYDHGEGVRGGPPGSPDADGDRFVELWNLVFMAYEQLEEERVLLPKPSIDTGMGLERIAAVMQGVHDNFDTDVFQALIQHSAAQSATSQHPVGDNVAHRVIADHLRSSSFLIADGVLPSNEGRGYVLRRILRRALRQVHAIGGGPSHLADLVPTLIAEMGECYGELMRAQSLIKAVLTQEGERFKVLLSKGLTLLSEWSQQGRGAIFPGEKAFQLYDTYGFPLDLTQDILRELGIEVDEKTFSEHMERQRHQSRSSWTGSGATVMEPIWREMNEALAPTLFVGDTQSVALAHLMAMVVEGKQVRRLEMGQAGSIVTDSTPFYGESGGQIGDSGVITGATGRMNVLDTQRIGQIWVHRGTVEEGFFELGDSVTLLIDQSRRDAIARNHSATHLLQSALRVVLGEHVTQKGSLVNAEKLRFDFSHASALSAQEWHDVELYVNRHVLMNHEVESVFMPQKEALESGAMALFGESYAEIVRVVTMGKEATSKELCGGTHVKRTGDIGLIKITSESGIAAGIRRIEAITGEKALQLFQELSCQMKRLSSQLRVPSDAIESKMQQLLAKKNVPSECAVTLTEKETLGTLAFWHAHVPEVEPGNLKESMDWLKRQMGSGVLALGTTINDKMTLLIGVSHDLLSQWNAKTLLFTALPHVRGGGRPDFAQGGSIHFEGDYAACIQRLRQALQQEKV